MKHVIRNHEARTAIVIGQGSKWIRLIHLQDGELVISKATDEDLAKTGYEFFDYPVDKAASLYLKHSGGCSQAAQRELIAILVES